MRSSRFRRHRPTPNISSSGDTFSTAWKSPQAWLVIRCPNRPHDHRAEMKLLSLVAPQHQLADAHPQFPCIVRVP